uniref:Uncharacterized protein n=1 Tax=Kalanchoe fedtschenkoi TaxID=63787 RepID=A0A7N0SZ88_KALFE
MTQIDSMTLHFHFYTNELNHNGLKNLLEHMNQLPSPSTSKNQKMRMDCHNAHWLDMSDFENDPGGAHKQVAAGVVPGQMNDRQLEIDGRREAAGEVVLVVEMSSSAKGCIQHLI